MQQRTRYPVLSLPARPVRPAQPESTNAPPLLCRAPLFVWLVLACLIPLSLAGTANAGTAPAGAGAGSTAFIENRGQIDSEVLYYATGNGKTIYLTRDAIVVDQFETVGRSALAAGKGVPGASPLNESIRRRGHAIWIRFENAESVNPEIGSPSSAHYNFFTGSDASRWLPGVPAYTRITYRGVWPGIDLVLSADGGSISCELAAARNADRSRARFRIEGADSGAGDDPLVAFFSNPGGAASEQSLDRDEPAHLVWSTFLGATAEEIGWCVALDASHRPVVTGVTFSRFFPTTPGAYDQSYAGLGDVFVSKLDASGSTLLWSTFLGGTSLNSDYGYAVALDDSGNPIVTGYTWSEDFPTTPGSFDPFFTGVVDAFVSKLDAGGGSLLWSTFLGGSDIDIGYSVDLDSAGNPVIAGRTLSADFPTTLTSYDPFPNGEEDVFVTKLSAAGNALVWGTYLGGTALDQASTVELDSFDAPVICGSTASSDYPGGTYAGGLYDVIATKLKPDGTDILWSRTLGGSSYEYGNGLALDSEGNPVLCGATDSGDFPVTPGAYDESYNQNDDVYVAKLDRLNGAILWATFLGGSTPVYETAFGLDVDPEDRPVLAGSTPSADFPVTADAYDGSHNGASDVFVARLDATGSDLLWSTFLGGDGDDYGWCLVADGTEDALVAGVAGSAQFPSTPGAYDRTYNGDLSDVFVARMRLFIDPAGLAAGGGDAAGIGLGLWPNPARGATQTVHFELPSTSTVGLDVFDAAGRCRAQLAAGPYGPGRHLMEWNGLDRNGTPLPAGMYYLRMRTSLGTRSVPVTILR